MKPKKPKNTRLQDPWKQPSWNLRIWHLFFVIFGFSWFSWFSLPGSQVSAQNAKKHHYTSGFCSIWCLFIFWLVRLHVGENYGKDIRHGIMLVKNWMNAKLSHNWKMDRINLEHLIGKVWKVHSHSGQLSKYSTFISTHSTVNLQFLVTWRWTCFCRPQVGPPWHTNRSPVTLSRSRPLSFPSLSCGEGPMSSQVGWGKKDQHYELWPIFP